MWCGSVWLGSAWLVGVTWRGVVRMASWLCGCVWGVACVVWYVVALACGVWVDRLWFAFRHHLWSPNTLKITGGCRFTYPSIHFHCACSTHKQPETYTDTDTHRHGRRREEKGEEKGEERRRKEQRRAKSVRIYRKRIGASSGAMYHTIEHSSVKYSLRCARIMHVVCCVRESVCATLHLRFVLPCRVVAGYAAPAVRPPRRNPKCMCLPSVAKSCMEGHEKQN